MTHTPLTYIVAGSKFNLFALSADYPQFRVMRDFEFYYEACLQNYLNLTSGIGLIYGFGDGIIRNFDVRPRNNLLETGIIDFISLPTPGLQNVIRHTITLTDNKSFIFFDNCLTGTDQRAWLVLSNKPVLDKDTQGLIEQHATSLGFNRDNFIFLRRDSCKVKSPVPGGAPLPKETGRRNEKTEAGLQKKLSVSQLYAQRLRKKWGGNKEK